MTTKILIFPFVRDSIPISERFDLTNKYGEYVNDLDMRDETFFDTDDTEVLSYNFNLLCLNNYKQLIKFKRICESEENNKTVKVRDYDLKTDREYVMKPYTRKSFLDNYYGKIETLSRDSELITGNVERDDGSITKITKNTYIIMLFYNGNYFGHIFSWSNGERLFLIGIRARIDNEFLPDNEKVKGITKYLFEGGRQLALQIGIDTLTVLLPLSNMRAMLPKLGFHPPQDKYITNLQLDDTLMGEDMNRCYDCYSREASDSAMASIDRCRIITLIEE